MTAKQRAWYKWYERHHEEYLARKRKYDREHAAEIAERMREYRQRPEVKARRKAVARAWYAKNVEAQRAKCKSYRERNPERVHALNARWQREFRAKCAADPKLREAHLEKHRKAERKYQCKVDARCAMDAAYYADRRAKRRLRQAIKRVNAGKQYMAKARIRIPDYLCKGQRTADTRSQWLLENRTAGAAGWAREQAIEKSEWRREHA